jgi:hypothetical protein
MITRRLTQSRHAAFDGVRCYALRECVLGAATAWMTAAPGTMEGSRIALS